MGDPSLSFLKSLRERRGLSLRSAAETLGITHARLDRWERSGNVSEAALIPDIAALYQVSVETIMGKEKFEAVKSTNPKALRLIAQLNELPAEDQAKVLSVLQDLIEAYEAKAAK